jgi:arginine decarboxylase
MTQEKISEQERWSIQDARQLYQIDLWGQGYFDINNEGLVTVYPQGGEGPSVPLSEIIEETRRRGYKFPLLVRFQDILRSRVVEINEAFRRSIKEYGYRGNYQGVFPIKVNQLREVVEEILDAGQPYNFGLEAGSKPELFAAIALQENPGELLICNGYKDSGYIRAALMGLKLGKKIILVIEKIEELQHIIRIARNLNVRPVVGIRARLNCEGVGRWWQSSGERAKFGLSTIEILQAVQILKKEELESSLQLLHFHIGSQLTDIQTVKKAVQEAARIYCKLQKIGFKIQYMDVGGGLGVDYDGTRSLANSSMNYTLQEYANDVIYQIQVVCDEEEVEHPNVVSESGRAIAAHHSVLVMEVFGSIEKTGHANKFSFGKNEHRLVQELLEIRAKLSVQSRLEAFHDALESKQEAQNLFSVGLLDLETKAKIEALFWDISAEMVKSYKGSEFVPEEIQLLEDSMGDQFLCNFSLFQSLIDHWALEQLFPIMPIQQLNEEPDREATLVDITCDSDGQIKRFIGMNKEKDTLPIHSYSYKPSAYQPYYLGVFMVGAYQDIMGDLHNLFGRVNEVHVFADAQEPRGYYIEEIIEGTTISEVLAYVQYDKKELRRRIKKQTDAAIKNGKLKPSDAMRILQEYDSGLNDYTYLSFDSGANG